MGEKNFVKPEELLLKTSNCCDYCIIGKLDSFDQKKCRITVVESLTTLWSEQGP